jgi:hypothetical protein
VRRGGRRANEIVWASTAAETPSAGVFMRSN